MKKSKDKITCPECGSKNIVFHGYRYNEKTKKRLRKCKNCGRKFTIDDGFLRMRFRKKDIIKSIKLYKRGFSLAEVKKELERNDIHVSRWTISKWYMKYGSVRKK